MDNHVCPCWVQVDVMDMSKNGISAPQLVNLSAWNIVKSRYDKKKNGYDGIILIKDRHSDINGADNKVDKKGNNFSMLNIANHTLKSFVKMMQDAGMKVISKQNISYILHDERKDIS